MATAVSGLGGESCVALSCPAISGKAKPCEAETISSTWSDGQTEGQITKLKRIKRQMYGRGKIDLLQARVLGAA